MKALKILVALLTLSMTIISCSKDNTVVPSDTITSQDYDFAGYNQLVVENQFNVSIHLTNDEESIRVEANDNLHQFIIIEKNLMVLTIKLDDKLKMEDKEPTLNVFISTDYIYSFRGSGASWIELLDPLAGSVNEINLSGASSFTGILNGNEVNAVLSGASTLLLEGQTPKFNLNLSGASTMQSYDFSADWLNTDLSGASSASLTVNTKLDVVATGASTVYYKGEGTVNDQNLTGGSQIIKVN